MNNHRPISVKDKLFCDREAQLDPQIHFSKIIHVVLGLWVILLRSHSVHAEIGQSMIISRKGTRKKNFLHLFST